MLTTEYYREIAIDHTKVGGSVANFPSPIDLTLNANVASTFGYDIHFRDSTGLIELPFEMESYDNSTKHWLGHVLIPSLNSSTDTIIRVYYGNPYITTNQSNSQVWSNYGLVYHFNENPATTNTKDSSPAGHHGVPNGSMTADDLVAGKIGTAIDFDGANDFLNAGDVTALNSVGAFSVSMWMNIVNITSLSRVFDKFINGSNDISIAPYLSSMYLEVGNGSNSYSRFVTTGVISNDTWYHLAFVFNGAGAANSDKVKIYINGANKGLIHTGTLPTTTANFAGVNLTVGQGQSNFYGGKVDELRLRKNFEPVAWWVTEYNSQNDLAAFIELRDEVTVITKPPHLIFVDGNLCVNLSGNQYTKL